MTLLQLHLVLVSFWFGLLAAESVLELSARDAAARRAAAVVHAWIDTLFEGPVVIAVLVTGALLLARLSPASPMTLVHAGLGVVPLIVNVACMKWVLARRNETDDERTRELTSKVKVTGLAIPVAIAAFAIGLVLAH